MKTAATTVGILILLHLAIALAQAATFSSAVTNTLAPFTPYGVVMADFNGDGYQDAAVTIYDGSTGSVRIFLGNGAGVLTFSADLPTGSIAASAPRGIVAADLNRDGLIDLAVANFNDNSVSVFLNNGSGTFTKVNYPLGAGTGPIAIAAGDFRGDGTRDDLAVLNSTGNSVAILLNNGAGVMTLQSSLTTTGAPLALAVGDFNGDDIDDIAVTPNALGHVTVFRGNGVGTFAAGSDIAAGNGPKALVAADFNNDGITDLAVLNSTAATISIVKGDKSGTLVAGTAINVANPLDTAANSTAMVAVDLNRDGILDLAVANSAKNSISVLTGYGDGTFAPADSVSATFITGTGPAGLASSDLNGGGNDLLSMSGSPNNSYSVLLNTSPAVAGLTVLPGSVDFGAFPVSSLQINKDKVLTLFNGGSATLNITSAIISGNSDFQVLKQGAATCTSIAPTIPSGSSCTILARFLDPITSVAESANLTFASNAASVPSVTVPLSGTGTPYGTPYTVKVSFLGRGGGTVNFSNGLASCISPAACSYNPAESATPITMTALQNAVSYLYGWTGCDSINNNNCVINFSSATASDRNLTANFGLVPRLVWNYVASTYTNTVTEACNIPGSGSINIVSGLFPEDLYLGIGSNLVINGGYDSSFSNFGAGAPAQLRSLTIATGSAVLDNIVLQ